MRYKEARRRRDAQATHAKDRKAPHKMKTNSSIKNQTQEIRLKMGGPSANCNKDHYVRQSMFKRNFSIHTHNLRVAFINTSLIGSGKTLSFCSKSLGAHAKPTPSAHSTNRPCLGYSESPE